MPKVFSKRLFNERGITLIELIAVILILGIIAAVGIPVVFNQIEKANEQSDISNLAIINDAIDRYAVFNGGYVKFDDFNAVITALTGDSVGGPFIKEFPEEPAVKGKKWIVDTSRESHYVTTGDVE